MLQFFFFFSFFFFFYSQGSKLRWPTRVTTHYLTTYYELLSTHFKLCTTHSKFLKTHSKFFETHFKFTTNSEIFTTHFEIFTTHSPQDPKCWQRKRNGYAAPPSSFDAMFCSTYACGQQLQESFVFRPKCGLRLVANVAQGSCDVNSQKNISSKHTFWQVLSTTSLLASLKVSTVSQAAQTLWGFVGL